MDFAGCLPVSNKPATGAAKPEAAAREEKYTTTHHREKERAEGRRQSQEAPAATAKRRTSPGKGAGQEGGDETAPATKPEATETDTKQNPRKRHNMVSSRRF